jgi:hypothetical protein
VRKGKQKRGSLHHYGLFKSKKRKVKRKKLKLVVIIIQALKEEEA